MLVALICSTLGFWCPDAVIHGVKSEPSRTSKAANGGLPVTITSNFDAVEIRLGNTPIELSLSSWRPYAKSISWLLPTSGPWGRVVYAEIKSRAGGTKVVQVPVPDYGWWGSYNYKPVTALSDKGWSQDFRTDAGRWMSYDYIPQLSSHTFYPVSRDATGGPDAGSFIWTDYSRVTRDGPDMNSFLVLINYSAWIDPSARENQLRNKSVDFGPINGKPLMARFSLRSDCPDLKGGSYYFWVLGKPGRMHKTGQPLVAGRGEWGPVQEIELSDLSKWTVTHGQRPDFSSIESFGISLLGASDEPAETCTIALGPITIGPKATDQVTRKQ